MITSYFTPRKPKTKTKESSEDNSNDTQINLANTNKRSKDPSTDQDEVTCDVDPFYKRRKVTPSPSIVTCPEVEELLSHLTEKSWLNALNKHVSSNKFSRLAKYVASQR